MMANLGVENNSKIQLSVTELPTGNFVKFKPQSTNFLTKISDPRAVLEHKLRNYAALKVGEVIYFQYVKNDYFLEVLECRPASHGAISIIEANLEVDFAPPDGYVEPTAKPATSSSSMNTMSSPFAMDEDDPHQSAEVDDLGLGADSEEDDDDDVPGVPGSAGKRTRSTSSNKRSKTPIAAFSGQGHRPSGKAVHSSELSLPELASSPSGRKFITSSGSLVIGPPSESSTTSNSANARGTMSPAAAAAAARAASQASSSKPATPQPTANNPVAATEIKTETAGFVAFSGAGHRLK